LVLILVLNLSVVSAAGLALSWPDVLIGLLRPGGAAWARTEAPGLPHLPFLLRLLRLLRLWLLGLLWLLWLLWLLGRRRPFA
jgi:hypothetical protein